jgi:diguanylate cyclase (GGDEF)-like protein
MAFWLSGIGFFVLSRHGFDSRRWASAFCLLGTGYGLMTVPTGLDAVMKPLVEDAFLLLGAAAMTAALSHRFNAPPAWRAQAPIMLAAMAGAVYFIAVHRSPRLETFAVQMGCALMLCNTLVARRDSAPTRGDRVMIVTFSTVCATLLLQCVGFLVAPDVGPAAGAWRATIWGFLIQLTGGVIAVALTFAILLAVSLDVIERLRLMSHTDALTGVLNRRGLEEACARLARSSRGRTPLAIVLVDLDHFKQVNDNFGHEAGDMVIVRMAQLLKLAACPHGEAARTGGEEFAVIVQDHDLDDAVALAHRVRKAFAHIVWPFDPAGRPRTASFGVASFSADESYACAMARADAMLYLAKRSGRNRVMARIPTQDDAMQSFNAQRSLPTTRPGRHNHADCR